MARTEMQQITHLLETAETILVTFPTGSSPDAIASATALLMYLEKIGKRVDVVADGFSLPQSLRFLKRAKKIQPTFSHLQKFIITVDVEKTGVDELSYDVKDEKLRIFVTPKQGFIARQNVRTAQSDFKYDLIITIGTRDLPSLGALYENNTELFYSTPIVNIDHDVRNEHYGQINVIDITCASTAEVLYGLLKKLGAQYITESLATALLTGIIAKTRSFKGEHVKPTTLATSSELMHLGADRERIVQHLYQTRSVSTLKLWGLALANLEYEKDIGLVWTTLSHAAFSQVGGSEDNIMDVVDELISNAPEARYILVLHEHIKNNATAVHGMLKATRGGNAAQLLAPFRATSTGSVASFILENHTLDEAKTKLLDHLKQHLNAG